LLPRIADVPILIVITYRPEFQSEWPRHPPVTALTLGRLSRGQGIEVVRAAGGAALSEDIVARIGQRAGGVPLFIEELTKSVLDRDLGLGDSEIPETLRRATRNGGYPLRFENEVGYGEESSEPATGCSCRILCSWSCPAR